MKKGYAMVMVICVMALIVALSLALLLVSSTVLASAQSARGKEESRVLAASLSETLGKQLTQNAFLSAAEESAAKTADGTTLWFYVKEQINGGNWPYYDEGRSGHSAAAADKTFRFQTESEAGKDSTVVLRWTAGTGGGRDGAGLSVAATCTANGQSCTVTTDYLLSVRTVTQNGASYEQWKWSRGG